MASLTKKPYTHTYTEEQLSPYYALIDSQICYLYTRISSLTTYMPYIECFNAGLLGLVDALHFYKKSYPIQTSFRTFAKHRIQGEIRDQWRKKLRAQQKRIFVYHAVHYTYRFLYSHTAPSPEIAVCAYHQRQFIRKIAQKVCTPREYQVICFYLNNWVAKEIAQELHVHESRISQMRTSAIHKIQKKLARKYIQVEQ
jgi:RNA polymerase sigma factor (sigma-70 family)